METLVKLKADIASMDRKNLFKKNNNKKEKPMDIAFITGFNTQYKDFKHILKKYWPILKEDRVLAKILPNKPNFIYRKAPNLRDYMVHNVINPPKPTKIFPDMKGFYKCQKCLPCRVSKKQPPKKRNL